MGKNFSRIKRFFGLLCLFLMAFPGVAQTNPISEPGTQSLSDAILYNNEVILDGHVDYTAEGMVMFTSEEGMVVLDGLRASGTPGQHIMVVGYPYKKGNNYHISVTGYTFLNR